MLRATFARTPFDGEGAYRYGGRWSSMGTRLAYASEHQSLAMLEYFVHLDPEDSPDDLVLATADVPDNLSRERIETTGLPASWRETPAPPELAQIGDEFEVIESDGGRRFCFGFGCAGGSEEQPGAEENHEWIRMDTNG